MFDATFKYAIDPANNTIKVGLTTKSLLKITLQSLAWSVGPVLALVAIGEAVDYREQVNRAPAKPKTEN